jgi:F0F1-type ATP synthase epsilon subunit
MNDQYDDNDPYTIRLEIASSEDSECFYKVTQVNLTTLRGKMVIYPNHATVIAPLAIHKMIVVIEDKSLSFAVIGGLFVFNNNKMAIYSPELPKLGAHIDTAKAKEELFNAKINYLEVKANKRRFVNGNETILEAYLRLKRAEVRYSASLCDTDPDERNPDEPK